MPVPPAALRTRLDDFPLMEKRLLEVASNDETVRRAPDRHRVAERIGGPRPIRVGGAGGRRGLITAFAHISHPQTATQ